MFCRLSRTLVKKWRYKRSLHDYTTARKVPRYGLRKWQIESCTYLFARGLEQLRMQREAAMSAADASPVPWSAKVCQR